jgi:hypothetical protein
LLVQVSSGAFVEGNDGQRLIQAFTEPKAFFITARHGLDLLTKWGHKIPATVKRLAEAEENTRLERDAQPARPLELWENLPQFIETTFVPTKRDNFIHLAWTYANSATNLFETLNRWRREGVVYDRDAVDCARQFQKRFRPDASRWLLEKKSPPPESLGVHELTWPQDLQDACAIIAQLQSLIAIPLVSTIAGRVLDESHEAYPNAAERNRGFAILDTHSGEIARCAGTLMEIVEKARNRGVESEEPTGDPAAAVSAVTPESMSSSDPLKTRVALTDSSGPMTLVPDSTEASRKNKQDTGIQRCVMERNNDGWVFTFRGSEYTFTHSLGLGCIYVLIKSPGQSIDAIDLDAAARVQPSIRNGDTGNNLDATAIAALNNRLEEIEEEFAEANCAGSIAVLEKLTTEKEQIQQQLLTNLGLQGRSRIGHAENDAARQRVRKNLKAAYTLIGLKCPDLAKHFESNIETGTSVLFKLHPDFHWEAH